jgi:hypothetical protein
MPKERAGLAAFIVLALIFFPAGPESVNAIESGIWEPCESIASGAGGCLIVCPGGDGPSFEEIGAIISITVENMGLKVPDIPAADIYLIGANQGLVLCGGSGSIDADSATSAFPPVGYTTISGVLTAGGCDTGLSVIVWGAVLGCPPIVLPCAVKSPDINGDLIVDIVDLALFAPVYMGLEPYSHCMDYNCDGAVALVDFALFGIHYLHNC